MHKAKRSSDADTPADRVWEVPGVVERRASRVGVTLVAAVAAVAATACAATDDHVGGRALAVETAVDRECGSIPSHTTYDGSFVDVLGSRMYTVDEGAGDPIVFLHGNPTTSYLWRNIMPALEDDARVIAPDLIGMGQSDKPDIDYRFATHAAYLEAFIDALELRDITFVVHDWGSGLGFDYAARHPDRVKAIAFMEAVVAPLFPATWDGLPPDIREFFELMRLSGQGETLVIDHNLFIEQVLPGFTLCGLPAATHDVYRQPYLDAADRRPLWVWPNEVPIAGEPADVVARVEAYNLWAASSPIPKLVLYATPGALIDAQRADWLARNWPNTAAVYIGDGLHFLQESNPSRIADALSDWYEDVDDNDDSDSDSDDDSDEL